MPQNGLHSTDFGGLGLMIASLFFLLCVYDDLSSLNMNVGAMYVKGSLKNWHLWGETFNPNLMNVLKDLPSLQDVCLFMRIPYHYP